MDYVTVWLVPALVAVVSAILSHALSTIRARAEWRREADLLRAQISQLAAEAASAAGVVNTLRSDHERHFVTIEKDLTVLDAKAKMLVTSYELEQRLEPMMLRIDELRRRIIPMEDSLFGYNLDGSLAPSQVMVRREP
jgi:hypothetical protein